MPIYNRREFLRLGASAGTVALGLSASSTLQLRGAVDAGAASGVAGNVNDFRTATGAFDVADRAQLFIDRHLVARQNGISFTVHPARKHPLNPLVRADKPWEGWWTQVFSVVYDESDHRFKMWYASVSDGFPHTAVYYAVSTDGVHWEKPLMNAIRCPGFEQHNAVAEFIGIATVFIDRNEPDPEQRFKMLGFVHRKKQDPDKGPRLFVSPDGINWKLLKDEALFGSSDVFTAFRDDRLGLYGAMPKMKATVRGITRRCFGTATSSDLVNWSPARMTFLPDVRDDAGCLAPLKAIEKALRAPINPSAIRADFYGVGTYAAESCMVAFPWVFNISNQLPAGTDDGSSEIQLTASRDIETWDRSIRDPILSPGGIGTWDACFLTTAARAFRHGDEVYLYYTGQNFSHAHPAAKKYQSPQEIRAVGLATWPLDRFFSVDGGSDSGQLTTIPVVFSGKRLELNLNAARGDARVRVLDVSGQPLPGYGLSDPVTIDSLRTNVSWGGKTDVSSLAGRPVVLEFNLKRAQLFSFAFRT